VVNRVKLVPGFESQTLRDFAIRSPSTSLLGRLLVRRYSHSVSALASSRLVSELLIAKSIVQYGFGAYSSNPSLSVALNRGIRNLLFYLGII
jgi:hypothetical protein